MIGAWTGGLFGLLVGSAFVILPDVGQAVIVGPLSAALLVGIEGCLAGAEFGALTGSFVDLHVSRKRPFATRPRSRPASSW